MPLWQLGFTGSRCQGRKIQEMYWGQYIWKIKGEREQELARRSSNYCKVDTCEKTGGRKTDCLERAWISGTKIAWEESASGQNGQAQCCHHVQICLKAFWSRVPKFSKLHVTSFRDFSHKPCTTIIMITHVLFQHEFDLEISLAKLIFSIIWSISG